jgi:undecaprenyl-diphosphatase
LIEHLNEIDKALFLFLNSDQFPWLDGPMWYFSKTWFWFPVDAYLIWTVFKKFHWPGVLWIVLAFALVVTIADQTSSAFLKNFVQRIRPSREPSIEGMVHLVFDQNGNLYRGGNFGFVSSHAANYMGVFVLYFLVMKPSKTGFVLALTSWVILISFSRIYLGVHYPGDVLGGWIVGSISAAFVYILLLRLKLKPVTN